MAAEHHDDLVITDWQMPRMTGIEMLRRIRGIPELRALPVLVATGAVTKQRIVEAAAAVAQRAALSAGAPRPRPGLLAPAWNPARRPWSDALVRSLFFALVLAGAPGAAQPVYTWTDAAGTAHYTDDPSTIPPGVKATTTDGEPLTEVGTPLPLGRAPSPRPGPAATPGPGTVPRAQRAPAPSGPAQFKLQPSTAPERETAALLEAAKRLAASAQFEDYGGLSGEIELIVPGDAKSYARLCPTGSAGCAIGTHRVVVASDGARNDRPGTFRYQTSESVLHHELGHALLAQRTRLAAAPKWFHEGFASFLVKALHTTVPLDVVAGVLRGLGGRSMNALFAGASCSEHAAGYWVGMAAIEYLVSVEGRGVLRALFEKLATGLGFDQALKAATRFTDEADFTRAFTRHVFDAAR